MAGGQVGGDIEKVRCRYKVGSNVADLDPHQIEKQDPHQSDKLEVDPYQDSNKKKLDPDPDLGPHQFADDKPKSMEYEPIWALFQGFEHLFGS
jgi:hypothetical protein